MKKFFALALALALTFAMAVTCFAARDINKVTDTKSADIVIDYMEGSLSSTVYGVDVEFGDMTFSYQEASEGKWNTETHEYDPIDEGYWKNSTADITVTNHSNAAIVATVDYDEVDGYEGEIEVKISKTTLELASAVGTAANAAPADTTTITVSGTPTSADDGKLGTITVSIAPAVAE